MQVPVENEPSRLTKTIYINGGYQLSAASHCSPYFGQGIELLSNLVIIQGWCLYGGVRHSEGSGFCWIRRLIYLFCHFRVITVRLHAGEVLLLPYQVGVGSNVASGHLLLVPCFCVLFISPSHSRCFSMSLWHHTLVNHNQMLFPGQHDMFRQMHTHSCTHSHSNTSLHCFVKN